MSSGGGLVKIAGVDKAVLREMYDIEVDDAVWKEFVSRKNGALLGIDIAKDKKLQGNRPWETGKEFVLADLGGISLYFAGTFTPRDPTQRSIILTGERFLEEVDDRLGTANQILVRIGHRDDADRIAEEINALDFPVAIHADRGQSALDDAFKNLDTMLGYAKLVIGVVAIVILVGLANATSMAVRERISEVGILRTLGFSRTRVVGLVAGETLLLSVLGAVIGCGTAWFAVRLAGMSMSSGGFSFPVTMTPTLAGFAAVAAAAVGVFGALPAGIRVSRRPVVEALRSVD